MKLDEHAWGWLWSIRWRHPVLVVLAAWRLRQRAPRTCQCTAARMLLADIWPAFLRVSGQPAMTATNFDWRAPGKALEVARAYRDILRERIRFTDGAV